MPTSPASSCSPISSPRCACMYSVTCRSLNGGRPPRSGGALRLLEIDEALDQGKAQRVGIEPARGLGAGALVGEKETELAEPGVGEHQPLRPRTWAIDHPLDRALVEVEREQAQEPSAAAPTPDGCVPWDQAEHIVRPGWRSGRRAVGNGEAAADHIEHHEEAVTVCAETQVEIERRSAS